MEHKFKVGDRVQMGAGRIESSVNAPNGTLGTIVTRPGNPYPIQVKWEGTYGDEGKWACGVRAYEIQFAQAADTKLSAPKFILQYHGSSCETFTSEKQLRARINELAADPTVKRDSIKVHDIKRTRTVTLGVKITLK
jgi:hypothetical protein